MVICYVRSDVTDFGRHLLLRIFGQLRCSSDLSFLDLSAVRDNFVLTRLIGFLAVI